VRRVIVFVGALLLLVACPHPGARAAGVVPWVATPPGATPKQTPSLPAGGLTCKASMIRVPSFSKYSTAAAGTIYRRAQFENITAAPCYFLSAPSSSFLDERGHVVESAHQMGTLDELPLIVYPQRDLIAKRRGNYAVALMFGTEDVCNPAAVSTMVIEFAKDSGRLYVSLPRSPGRIPNEPACPSNSGHVAFLDSDAPPPAEPTPSPLKATMISIGTVHANERLRFVVRISNPGSDVVSLDPCPSYTEGLKGIVTESHQLNCSTVRAIPGGRSVEYEMFLAIPALSTSELHQSLLVWDFNGGAGPSLNFMLRQ
jgi:hypothetical protein